MKAELEPGPKPRPINGGIYEYRLLELTDEALIISEFETAAVPIRMKRSRD